MFIEVNAKKMDLKDKLKWRYATKRFSSKELSKDSIEFLKESVNLSASSYGLQPYKVLVIKDPVIREKLREASWGQPQITEASHLFLFCNYAGMDENVVDEYIDLRSKIQGVDKELLKGYGEFMKGAIMANSPADIAVWTSKQTYIALGTLLIAAAEKEIDACPMEGFDKEAYDKILGLESLGLRSSVLCAVGYRSVEDETQHYKKVRKDTKDMFIEI